MTSREALVGLNLVSDIGSRRLLQLLEYFTSPQEVLAAPRDLLERFPGIGSRTAARIRSVGQEEIDREFETASRGAVTILTWDDQEYPESLRHIPGAPPVLYVKGELRQTDTLSIAVVGSRLASYYGLSAARKFSAELSRAGLTIVSGLARGIDACAHRASLQQGGRTVAVLGSGLSRIYPAEHAGLAEEISRNGALVSEFPFLTEPLKQNFPRRNRIISGLSLGVLVVEACRNSGALITADFALEQGREVFAVPGKVDSSTSFGTNGLIKQGAKPACCLDDILEEFEFFRSHPGKDRMPDGPAQPVLERLIGEEPISLDELIERLRLPVPVLADKLLRLELDGTIRQIAGSRFVRKPAERERLYAKSQEE